MDQTIKATACYPYKTKATEKVCIDPDVRNLIKDKVCKVHDISTNGQGAPISVSRIEQDIFGNNVIFKIYFVNTGGGEVYHATSDSSYGNTDLGVLKCFNGNLEYNDFNKIILNKVILGGKDITTNCKPGTLRLTGNSGYMICRCEGSDCVKQGDAYETLLEIELEYGYKQSIQQPMQVIRVPLS